jgi:predicted permease
MRWIRVLRLRLRSLLHARQVEQELDEELGLHLQRQIEAHLAAGMSPEEARRTALLEFGGIEQRKEECRDARGLIFVDGIRQDLGYALRTLSKSPAFTAVAVLSLGLGIGANTAIFTFVHAALLKPLPYPQAERIVMLQQRAPESGTTTLVHPVSFVEWRERARSFEALAIGQALPVNTDGADGAEMVSGYWSTAGLFRVFGVDPTLGRAFAEEESRPGAGQVVVLSDGYWRRRFGADPRVMGRTMRIGGSQATVVGVMPPGFRVGTLDIDVYYPLPLDRSKPEAVGSRSFQCYGRLRPGVSLEAARAEMTLLADQIGQEIQAEKGWRVQVSDLRDALVRDNRLALLLLFGVVAFVLLIACANLAGLLLTRGVGRRSELALRASVGASRFRLVQQLVVESLVLAGLGGALGLFLGAAASRGLVFLASDAVEFGQMADVQLDAAVLAFTVGISVLTAILFGLVPAWQASRFDLQAALAERGRGGSDSRGQHRVRGALMIGEVALAVVLLAGSGLLLRTFANLLQVKLGFEPAQALTMQLFLTDDAPRRASLVESILERVETLPGVRAVGTIQFLPLSGWTNNGPFHFVGRPEPTEPLSMASDVSTVSRGYFEAMGIPLLRGRSFDRRDRMQSPRVAVVNQAFVDRYSPQEDPLGQVILGDWANPRPTEIVGIVGDLRHNGLTSEPRPTVFLAQAQVPGYITYVVVRTSSDLPGMAAAVRREIQQVDPRQAVTAVQPMRQYVSAALARPRLYAVLLGAFAALALVLSAVGLYGLMAYAVSRRTHEIGIRMALGARGADVLRSILGQGARLAVTGLAAGTLCAVASSRLLTALLYGVSPSDPLTYVGATVVLGGVALAAAFVPARRASRVDPILALRYD